MHEAAYCREHSDLLKNDETRQSKEVVGELVKGRRQQDPRENIGPAESWKQLVKDIMRGAPEVDMFSNGIVTGITKGKARQHVRMNKKSHEEGYFSLYFCCCKCISLLEK